MELDNIATKVAKIVAVKRTKYFSWRYLTNAIFLSQKLTDDARARENENERKEIENRKPTPGLFGGFIDGLATLSKKRKSEEYYDGYKRGAFDTIEFCKHYFVSSAVTKEKEEKLIKFLHDEGITICTNPTTGSIMVCDMYKAGDFVEHKIIYEDKEDTY